MLLLILVQHYGNQLDIDATNIHIKLSADGVNANVPDSTKKKVQQSILEYQRNSNQQIAQQLSWKHKAKEKF